MCLLNSCEHVQRTGVLNVAVGMFSTAVLGRRRKDAQAAAPDDVELIECHAAEVAVVRGEASCA